MKKYEFLSQLKAALENELDTQSVREHIDYYEDYIRSEMNKGLSEEAVLEQLGSPWAIAKTILLSEKINGQSRQGYTSETEETRNTESENYQVAKNSRWKIYAAIAVVILVLLVIVSFVFGIIAIVVRLAIRFAVPLLVIALVWRFFQNRK